VAVKLVKGAVERHLKMYKQEGHGCVCVCRWGGGFSNSTIGAWEGKVDSMTMSC
jgi:hypothetical protein